MLKAGSKIKFDFHYHSVGKEITDQSQLGIVLYPKGYMPKHIVYSKQLGQPTEPLDIPGGAAYVRSDGYQRFNKAGKHHGVPAAHAHARQASVHRADLSGQQGRADQLLELHFNWHIVHVYADDAAPIYPAGTVLHVISWHDNSANKGNPDPRNWVGSGNRTIDEMGFAWITWYDMTRRRIQGGARCAQGREKTSDQRNSRSEARSADADCGLVGGWETSWLARSRACRS